MGPTTGKRDGRPQGAPARRRAAAPRPALKLAATLKTGTPQGNGDRAASREGPAGHPLDGVVPARPPPPRPVDGPARPRP